MNIWGHASSRTYHVTYMSHPYARHDSFIHATVTYMRSRVKWYISCHIHDVSVLSWLNLKANKDYFSYEYMRWRVKSCISCHIHESCMSCMSHTWLVHMHDLTRLLCVTWLVHTCDMTRSYARHDSFIHATWLVHTCDMTRSYMRHDSFVCTTWLVLYVWHDSFICVTWLLHMTMCNMTYFTRLLCVTWLIHICDSFIYAT